MKQLWLKEWREQFKVALIGLGGMTLVLLQAVRGGIGRLDQLYHGGTIWAEGLQPLISSELLGESALFCGFFGLVLGWLQIHSESHRDLRAFLMHRPVDRLLPLHAKFLSGLTLYTLAVGVPFLGLLVYVLIPGHVPAPFEWAMVGPITAVFLLGLVGYGAGILTSLRPARWYGSRIFGLGPAIFAAIAVFAARDYTQALAALLAAGVVLYLAIRGTFKTGGDYQNQPWGGKMALSITCAAAGILLCALAMAVLATLLRGPQTYQGSDYQVTEDGNVYRVMGNEQIFDLNGQHLLDPKTGKPIRIMDFRKTLAETRWTGVVFDKPTPYQDRRLGHYNSIQRYYIPWRINHNTLWYWLPDGRLVGYDGVSRRVVGRLAPSKPAERFWVPENYYETYFQSFPQSQVLVSTHTVYQVDLEAGTLTPCFTTTNQDGIGGFSDNDSSGNKLVVTRDAIHLLDAKGGADLNLPYQPGWPQYSTIQAYWLEGTNGFAVAFFPDYRINQQLGGKLSSQLVWVNQAGHITRTLALPKLLQYEYKDTVGDACSLVFPPALRLPIEYIAHHGYTHDYWDVLSAIPALLCVLAGWLQGRRYHFTAREQAAWAVFHAIFGIPGLIAFYSVQEWPAKEPCPHCHKLRLVNREQCEYCGGAFAPPALNGTEIFAPVSAEAGVKG